VHICPIKGDHDVGLACLSDGQVLPILLNLDPDDLLNLGRASPRLYRLVSDWEVWTHLLKRVIQFSNERVEHLINFREESSWFGIVPRPKMIMEVVKEVAFRCQEEASAEGGPLGRGFRVTLALDNEEAAHTYEMTGDNYREEFNRVATMVEFTMFTILKVQTFGSGAAVDMNTLRMLAAQVDRQDSRSLCKLEVEMLILFCLERTKLLLELMKVTEEWKIETVIVGTNNKCFTDLAKCSARGHVGTLDLSMFSGFFGGPRLIKEDVKAIWEISEKIGVEGWAEGRRVGGGRDKDSNVTWEEAYESFKMFC